MLLSYLFPSVAAQGDTTFIKDQSALFHHIKEVFTPHVGANGTSSFLHKQVESREEIVL